MIYSPMRRLPCLLALLYTIAASPACDRHPRPAKEDPKSQKSEITANITGTNGDVREKKKKESLSAPIEEPLAYFGQLKLKRLVEPVQVAACERGSVVLLVIDALNAKHLGVYGYDRDTSPNMDRLAEQGLLFSNFVSNSSWTRPSFTTIITGQPKRVHKIEWNGNSLAKEITTLAERFRDAGYKTAGIVGNQLIQKIWEFDQGFQTFEDVKSLNQIFPRDELLMTKAIDWLKTAGDDPFFLMVFLIDPHMPYRPLKPHRGFLDSLPEGPVTRIPLREYPKPLPKLERDRIVAAYDGEVQTADAQIARLFEFLRTSDKLKNTTVAITADHGEAFGEHNCYTHTYHMWESVLRVPFLIVSPAIPLNGAYDDRPFTHVDIAPTLLDLVGVNYPKDELPGLSMVDVLRDPSKNRERVLFSQYNAHGVRRQAIRKGPWKLIHHHKVEESAKKKLTELQVRKQTPDAHTLPSLAWDKERYEFYNLVDDPMEMNDLFSASQKSPELKSLMDDLTSLITEKQEPGQFSEEMIKALRNVGYIKKPEQENPLVDAD
jgi:arylsulfatase A-like enzyme